MQCLTFKAALAASVAFALSFGCITHAQTASGSNGLATRINTSAVTSNATFNRFIVRYNASTPMTAVTATQGASAAMTHAMKLQATLSSNAPTVSYKRALATGAHLIATSRKLSASEATAFMQSIASDPTVAYVQPDVMRHPIQAPASFTPNDNYFAKYQTDFLPGDGKLTPISSAANWGGANITGAWDLADGTGITIAVLDTGIVKHADLDTSLADDGYDFLTSALNSGRPGDGRAAGGWDLGDWTTGAPYSSGPDACVDAAHASGSSWHGSHVAGASGAEITNNGIGMAGMAYKAKVLPVRVLGHCGGPDSDIADAIVWASGGHVDGVPDNKHPAQVINMSLGGDGACTADDNTAQAIAKARANGTTVIVAAGNSAADVKDFSPASCPGAITVAANGVASGLAVYSNYNGPGETIVKLAAFGGGIYANDASSGTQIPEGFAFQAVNSSSTTPTASPAGDDYIGYCGTSQATPHVTGAVALMQSARLAMSMPLLKPDEVLTILQKTARTPHITPNANKTFGAGILDAGAAVAEAVKGGGTPPTDNATVLQNGVALTGQKGDAGSEAFYKIDVPANARALVIRTAGGTGDVSLYVKAGAAPTATSFDASSVHAGSNAESVTVARVVAATTYYLRVVGVQAYAGVSVQATYTPQ